MSNSDEKLYTISFQDLGAYSSLDLAPM